MVSFDALKTAISGLRNWANSMFVFKSEAEKDIDTINNKFDEIQNELINLDSGLSNLNNELDVKVDKISGKQLSSNDYTTTEKNKLAGIASGATKVQYVYESATGRQRFNYSGNTASADYTHAEGYGTKASALYSHAEGQNTTASGECSHAEGYSSEASGEDSHAEGWNTTAGGVASHAEGWNTIARGSNSHTEGTFSVAKSADSHAEGYYTIANSKYQHVQGKYNIEDAEDKYAHIVGNGSSDSERSNAHTLDWNGFGWFAGGLKVGGTGQDDANAKAIATQEYVDEQVNNTVTNLNNTYAERTLLEGFDLKINNQWSYSRDPAVHRIEFYDGEDLVGTAYTTTISYSSGYSFSYFQNTQEVWDNIKKYKCLIYDSEGTQFAPVNFFYTAYWIGNILCTSSDGEKLDPITSFDVNNPYGRKIVGEIETIKLLMQTHYAEIFDAINANYTDILDIIDTPKNYVILNSSTPNSTKKFKLTIGDDGIISTEEVIE